jgi:hypothetical protein
MKLPLLDYIYTYLKKKTGNPYILWLLSDGWVCGDGNIHPLFVVALKIGDFVAKMGVGLLYTPS